MSKPLQPYPYFGGKYSHLKHILPLIETDHDCYIEPFLGSGVVFLNKKPHPVEVINDLNGNVIAFFRCLQDVSKWKVLKRRIKYTLYSREEHVLAVRILKDKSASELDKAWALFYAQSTSFQGKNEHDCVLRIQHKSFSNPLYNGLARLDAVIERLRQAIIENRSATDIIKRYSKGESIFYLDPPYIPETRKSGKYALDCDVDFHKLLVKVMLDSPCQFVLSGYDNRYYEILLQNGYRKLSYDIKEGSPLKGNRTECLWTNV